MFVPDVLIQYTSPIRPSEAQSLVMKLNGVLDGSITIDMDNKGRHLGRTQAQAIASFLKPRIGIVAD